MATIALYASQINQMSGAISEMKQSVRQYKDSLFALHTKTLNVERNICDLDDVMRSIQTSTQTQDEKVTRMETLERDVEAFVVEAKRADSNATDAIQQNKADFYDAYEYLKPDSEKSDWENFWNDAGTWCKEHWKLIATVIIVTVAVILICTGVGGILGAMALGALFGAAIGGAVGGTISALQGKSFLDGFENGAFSGAIAGILSGGMGFGVSAGGRVALSLGQTMLIGGGSSAGATLIGDVGDKYIKGTQISWGEIALRTVISGAAGAAFSGIGYGISKAICNSSWLSNSRELFRIGKTPNPQYGKVTSYTTSTPKGVSVSFAGSSGKSWLRIELDASMLWHYHLPSLFASKAHIPLLPTFSSAISSNQDIISALQQLLCR